MPELGHVRAVRRWRGRDITIVFDAAQYHPEHECVLTLDGVVLETNLITESMLAEGASAEAAVRWVAPEHQAPDVLVRNRERSPT
jgi:hypothetical protein